MTLEQIMAAVVLGWIPGAIAVAWALNRWRVRRERRRLEDLLAGLIPELPKPARRDRAIDAWLAEVRRTRGRPPATSAKPPRPAREFTVGRQARARKRFDRMGALPRRGQALALLTRDAAVRLLAHDPTWNIRVAPNGEVRCWR